MQTVLACALATVVVAAQSQPSFEVATIKKSDRLDSGGSAGFQPGGRFRAVNVEVIGLILSAYGTTEHQLLRSQLLDAPDWLSSTRYDIAAKVSDNAAAQTPTQLFQQMPLFLQSLLKERFRLRVHQERRDMAVFALRLLRPEGPRRMRPSDAQCPDERDKCSLHFQAGRVSGGAMTMPTLVSVLARNAERVVVDETGLQGAFDVTLEWSPDQTATDKPSIFAAVQEQLGLKLESTRAPVDVVVIDRIERPTED